MNEELKSALEFLTTGGSIVVTNWVISWFLEDTPAWHKLKSKTRSVVSFLLASAVGLSAYQASISPGFLDAIAPYAKVLLSVGGSWYALQMLHKKNPNREE